MIGDVWIIDKHSGVCLIHKNYDKSQNVDANLFSGLLTAIINFSAEVTGGDYVKSVTMGSKKFFYSISDYFIIAVSMDLGFNEVDAKIFLGNILTTFVKLGFLDKALRTEDVLVLKPFELEIDKIVHDTARGLAVGPGKTHDLAELTAVKEIDAPETKLKKAKIEDAIENAEWSLSMGYYKDALVYFETAVNLFRELEEFDMAKWCEEMIELTKMMELQEEIETISETEKEIDQPIPGETPETSKMDPILAKKAELLKDIGQFRSESTSEKTVKKIVKPTSKRYAERRPSLVKKLGSQKLPLEDLKVLRLCNGTNNIQEITNKSNLALVKVNEIIRKYQKKKMITIKRVIS
ncbi:MAG: hypothetical protein ACFFCM_07720 [Promethearchaeota archaeon]